MANSFFQFKQFTIKQELCAMKVGTDGVLLGAWSSLNNAQKILDIGTGTGLIALMLSQRSDAITDAIDIDLDAYKQATENINNSLFKNRIKVFHTPLSTFANSTTNRYELIVSNPPYFNESLKGPDEKRNKARHTDSLQLEELIRESKRLLAPNGQISIILPFDQQEQLASVISDNSLYIQRQAIVYPKHDLPPRRILTEISTTRSNSVPTERLVIEKERHVYTSEYIALTQAFYLKM